MSNEYYEDEFVDTVDTYSLYQSMNQLDLAEDILLRINVNENDLGEIEEALGEAVRLLREARLLIEVVTGDAETEDEYWAEPDKDDPNDDA